MISRSDLESLDRTDPLARCRAEFELPEGLIYLDGNSLGPLPRRAARRVREVVEAEWGRDLIRSWNLHGWIDLPRRVGDRIAPLIGAEPGEVVAADSTSIDLFKLAAAVLEVRPERRVVLSEAGNFPTDLYMLQGLVRLLAAGGGRAPELRCLEARGELEPALGAGGVALAVLTQVDYRTGELWDLAATTRLVHDAGALVLWDLSHSAGALPVDLGAAGADLAVGCGYKYLNGGPGAPAFLYVARRWQEALRSPLQGWLGHAAPFAFEPDYRPAPGIERFQCGTPPILALAALDAALELFAAVDLAEVRAKSLALGDRFLALVDQECADLGLEVACPRDGSRRGSQVALRHREGYAIVQALAARGVVGDFRAPDVLRFGLAPLYLRYADLWDAARHLREVLEGREWDRPEHRARAAVT
ncbi:MAG TPA: kynureninase [Thermoanaerobaculia bacterium]|nr:kynureninase [Thermoanaerobaculia bacterium]